MPSNFPVHFARSCASYYKHLTLKGLPPKALDAWARAIGRWRDFAHGSGDFPEVVLAASFRALIGTASWCVALLGRCQPSVCSGEVLKKFWAMPGLSKCQRLPGMFTVDAAQRLFLAMRGLCFTR